MLRTLPSPSSLLLKSRKAKSDVNMKLDPHSLSELQRSSGSWLSLSKSFEKQPSSNYEKMMLTSKNVSGIRSKTYEDVETLLLGRRSGITRPGSLRNCPSTGPLVVNLLDEQRAPSHMGEANLKANFVPMRPVGGRARSEPILTTTVGEQIIGVDILQSLPPRLLNVVTKQVSTRNASTAASADVLSVSESFFSTTSNSGSDIWCDLSSSSSISLEPSRVTWAQATEIQSSLKHSYVRSRPVPCRKFCSPSPKNILWSAQTYQSVFEDSSDEDEDLDRFDSFDSFFHADQTRSLWPLPPASTGPEPDTVRINGITIPAQSSEERKLQVIRERKGKDDWKDLPLFIESQDATPNYFANFWRRPVQFWVEPHDSPGITTEQIYPLSHTNPNLPSHDSLQAHPQDNTYHSTLIATPWHTTCPLDNTHHTHTDPTTLYSGETCKCFLASHGLKLLSRELTHGEGAGPHSNGRCWICWAELGYTGPQTLTHAIPYFDLDKDGGGRQRTYVSCGQNFHLRCAEKYVKATGVFAPCPACNERWHVAVEFGAGERVGRAMGALFGKVRKAFGFAVRDEDCVWVG